MMIAVMSFALNQGILNKMTTIHRDFSTLLLHLQETLDTEIKTWLDLSVDHDCANLAKELIALANHGGGQLIFGFNDNDGVYEPSLSMPSDQVQIKYTPDKINNIIKRFAEPAFHCEVHYVESPGHSYKIPIIFVPGGHKTPIRAKRDGPNKAHISKDYYYIRRPGAESAPPQGSAEWDALIRRSVVANRDELLEQIKFIIDPSAIYKSSDSSEHLTKSLDVWHDDSCEIFLEKRKEFYTPENDPYRFGSYSVSYSILADVPPIDLVDLIELIRSAKGKETGWPPWMCPVDAQNAPRPKNDLIECWIRQGTFGNDPSQMDFWRASPMGNLFIIRGYSEDSPKNRHQPGTIFDLTLPIWRIGECLLHSARFSAAIKRPDSIIAFRVKWTGLKNRRLCTWANIRRTPISADRISYEDGISTSIQIRGDLVYSTLVDSVSQLTKPLYAIFNFFRPPENLFAEEITAMLKGR